MIVFFWKLPSLRQEFLYYIHSNSTQKYVFQDEIGSIPSYAFDLAGHLLDPSGGNVVFVVLDDTLTQQKLFASKQILENNSEYFACRMTL